MTKYEIFWKNPGYVSRSKLKADAEFDYLVAGGGTSGIMACHYLKAKGAGSICLIEKGQIGSGATGASAGLLTPSGEADFADMVDDYGKKKAVDLWNESLGCLSDMRKAVGEYVITTDFTECPSIYLSYSDGEDDVSREFRMSKSVGMDVRMLDSDQLKDYIATDVFKKGMMSQWCASVNPMEFFQNFSNGLSDGGVKVYENTPLVGIRGNVASTPYGKIKFKKAVVALDSRNFDTGAEPRVTSIGVTKRLSKRELGELGFTRSSIMWDCPEDGYNYWKLTGDGRLLVGSTDKKAKSGKINRKTLKDQTDEVHGFTKRLFPANDLKMEYAWSGVYTVADSRYLPVVRSDEIVYHISGSNSKAGAALAAKYVTDSMVDGSSSLDGYFIR